MKALFFDNIPFRMNSEVLIHSMAAVDHGLQKNSLPHVWFVKRVTFDKKTPKNLEIATRNHIK